MKETYAKMTFRLVFISFLAFILIGCGESGSPGGSGGPGVTAAISLKAGLTSMPADGVTSTTITAVLSDSANAPVNDQTSVVFRTTRGTFRNGSTEYRVKTADTSGSVTVTLIADSTPGTAEVWAESNNISQKIEVRFYDPTKVRTITLRTGSASITADGASKVSVIATVTDYLGNTEEGATVTFKTSLGSFENANFLPGIFNRTTAITDVDGEAAVMLVSGTTIGTATILASLDGLNTTVTVVFTADEPKIITLRAAPSTIRPNGTSTLFARLFDVNGNPVAGKTINFSQIANASEGTLSILTDDTDVNGEAQATYTAGKDPGTDILQAALASDLSKRAQTSVVVDPAAIVVESIDVSTGSATLVADAKSQVKIRAIVTDMDGNPAASKTVTFTTTAGTLSSLTDTTDANGIAEVMLRSTTIAGPVIVRAECDGFIDEETVEFVPGPAHHILMYALPDTVPPNGPFTTAAIIQDQYDNRIDDQRLMLQVRRAGIPDIVDTAEMTPDQAEDGVFRFDWTAAIAYGPGNLEITARVNNGVSKTVTVVVDETATIVGSIELEAGAEEIKADGTSSVLIRATVLDYNGDPAEGITVDFYTSLGTLSVAQKKTDANGIADVFLRSGTTWGTATVTADANGFWGEVAVRFTSLKAGGVSLTAMPRVVGAGKQSTIIAELRDANGSPVPNEVLYFDIFENNTGATLNQISGTTDTNGRATVTYTAGIDIDDLCGVCSCSGDRIQVTLASDSTIKDTTCVSVVSSPLGSIVLTTSLDTLPPDGESTTNLRATVKDADGNPVSGVAVTFTTTAGSIDPSTVVTDVYGIADTILTAAETAGTALVTATNTATGFSDTLEIYFGSGPPAEDGVTVTAVPKTLTADGTSTSTVNIEVRDADGNPVSGATLVLTVDFGTLSALSVVTANGKASVTYTAPSSKPTEGIATITATTTNGQEGEGTITLTGALVAGITLSAFPETIPANGTSQTTIKAVLTAVGGGTVPDGTEVTFSIVNPAVAAGVNTGNGVMTLASLETRENWSIACTSAAANGGTFTITGDESGVVGTYNVATNAFTPSSIPDDYLDFAISDGTTDFIVGDTFTITDNGFLTPTIATTASGEAITFLTSGTTAGIITIRAESGGRIAEIDIPYTSGSITLTIIPNSLLGTGDATAEITALVLDVNDNPVFEEEVTITLSDLSLGTVLDTVENPNPGETDVDGEAVFIFQGAQKGGTVTVIATTESGLRATGTIDIQPPPAFIQVAEGYPDPTVINISGTGGVSTSQIVFDVKDIFGQPVADGYRVDMTILDGPNGGEAIEPISAYTSDGQISTILRSGVRSGPVSIKATYYYNSSVFTVVSQIVIASGPPVGEEFGIFANFLNISGLWKANLEDTITVNVNDISGNSVPDGTAVAFKTYNTGGAVFPGSDTTEDGLASNTLRSVGTYTAAQGFLTVTAETNNGGRTTHVTDIAVTPQNPSLLYAATDGGGVYKSINAGASWTNVSRSSELAKETQNYIDPYVNSLCIDPDNAENIVYAATGYLGRGNIYRSIDGGITWLNGNFEDWFGLLSVNNAVLTITCDDDPDVPDPDAYVWAGTDGLGAIFADDGVNFKWGGVVGAILLNGAAPANDEMLTGDLTGLTQEDPILSATSKSEDWTVTYTQTDATVTDLSFTCGTAGCPTAGSESMTGLDATATAGDETWRVRYRGGWTDPVPGAGTPANALFIKAVSTKTVNETWTIRCTAADNLARTYTFTVHGSVSGFNTPYTNSPTNYTSNNGEVIFYIDTTAATGIGFATTDVWTFNTRVDSWNVIRDVNGVNGGPELQNNRAKTGVTYVSDNNEVTFRINTPATSTRFYRENDRFEFDTVPIGEWVLNGTVSGLQDKRAQTGIPYTSDNGQVSFIIVEDEANPYEIGDYWEFTVTESGLGYGKIVRDIVREPDTHGVAATLYAATASGVYKSINGGLIWTVTQRFTGDNITCLVHHPNNAIAADVVYAGTESAGVWYTINGGTSWTKVPNSGLGGGLSASMPTAALTNVGNGIMSEVEVFPETLSETWTVRANADPDTFTVTGSVSPISAIYTVSTDTFSTTLPVDFTITAGSVAFAEGDTFTFRTTRDTGSRIKDLVIDSGNGYVYAATYFNPPFEPFHGVGNVYSLAIRASDGAPRNPGTYSWTQVAEGLPAYDPPDDLTLFPQHALAFDDPTNPAAMYSGGEGINLSKATAGLDTGTPSWVDSKTGLTNLIMARMPILFTGPCTMNIANIEYDDDTKGYTYTVYVQDVNGNPPIVGSTFVVDLLDGTGKVIVTLLRIEYPDTYMYQGTWRDPANPDTDNPFIVRAYAGTAAKIKFSFTPTCDDEAPGCSGSTQEITYDLN